MAYPVTGSPVETFVDAVRIILQADVTLTGLVTGVFGHLSEAARTAYPYLVLGRQGRTNEAGAMQVAGSMVTLQIDAWSDAKGPHATRVILSRVAQLLERVSLTVAPFTYVEGSLTCEFEEVFDEPDADKPESLLYHGVQRWTAEIHES